MQQRTNKQAQTTKGPPTNEQTIATTKAQHQQNNTHNINKHNTIHINTNRKPTTKQAQGQQHSNTNNEHPKPSNKQRQHHKHNNTQTKQKELIPHPKKTKAQHINKETGNKQSKPNKHM